MVHPDDGAPREKGADQKPSHRVQRWIVLVARDQQSLYEDLSSAFRGDPKVEVVLDRRGDGRRNPPWVVERLRTHGVAVIRRESRDATGP